MAGGAEKNASTSLLPRSSVVVAASLRSMVHQVAPVGLLHSHHQSRGVGAARTPLSFMALTLRCSSSSRRWLRSKRAHAKLTADCHDRRRDLAHVRPRDLAPTAEPCSSDRWQDLVPPRIVARAWPRDLPRERAWVEMPERGRAHSAVDGDDGAPATVEVWISHGRILPWPP